VFKCFCNDITDDGLVRMLRVIKKNLKPARHPDAASADEDDDDEDDDLFNIEDEEIDQAETGETGDSDGQTDDSESVFEAEETGQDHHEDSDDSDSGMDDDAMFRMDTYLAQIFKEKKNQAGSKPQVLTVYSHLARAFVNPHTAEVSEQLSQRIWGILQKKILKGKAACPKGDEIQLSTLESLLERNLKLASRPFKKQKSATASKQKSALNRHKTVSSFAQKSTLWILRIVDARNFTVSERQRIVQVFQKTVADYLDSKKSQIKAGFLKEIIQRRPWIGHGLFGFLLERCGSAKSDFRRVETLDLVMNILKSLATSGGEVQNASKKIVKNHLDKLSHSMKELVTNMPSKPARRTAVLKFCVEVFKIMAKYNLTKYLLKTLAPDAQAALEAQLGEKFVSLKKLEK
ncbi:DNA polymerase v-like protein, partial [Trifolium pratense]